LFYGTPVKAIVLILAAFSERLANKHSVRKPMIYEQRRRRHEMVAGPAQSKGKW